MGNIPEHRAVVTWEGPGETIMLTLYGPSGDTRPLWRLHGLLTPHSRD